jgi:hypothetical protein
MALEKTFQVQLSTKLLKKDHPAVVSKGGVSEGDFDFPKPFWHLTQNTLPVRFVSMALSGLPADYAPSRIS